MSIDRSTAKQKVFRSGWLPFVAGLILLLAACGPSAPPPQVSAPTSVTVEATVPAGELEIPQDESAYPPPVEMPQIDEAYPVETLPPPEPTQVPDSYPAVEEVFAEPRFRMDTPLTADSGVVSGQAPPNLAIAIVDISTGGEMLGAGVSDAEGLFTIGVSRLPVGHQLGVTFSELEPGKTHAEMSEEYFPYRGDGFMNIPNIGIFFDTVIVEP